MAMKKKIEAVIILVPQNVRTKSGLGYLKHLGHNIYKIRVDETVSRKEQLWLTIHELIHLAINLFCVPSLPGEALSASLGNKKEEDIADKVSDDVVKKLNKYWVEE